MMRMELHRIVARKKAFIFDLFYTLTSVEEAAGGPSTSALLGIERGLWNRELLERSPARLKGRVTDPREIIGGMARALNPSVTDDAIDRAVEYRRGRFRDALLRMPAASVATLAALRRAGKKTALCSNADVMERARWDDCPAAPHFDCTIFSCDVGFMKPEADIYRICLECLAVEPGDCLFMGDGGSNELEGARAAGITTVAVTGHLAKREPDLARARAAQADYSVAFVDELVAGLR